MVSQKRGLIVTTTFWDRDRYLRGNLFYDLAKAAMNRLAFGMAQELRPHGVASLAVSPGWMRTELVLAGHKTDEAHWQERPALARTESPRYLGRAVAALAQRPAGAAQERRRASRGGPGAASTASPTSMAGRCRRSRSREVECGRPPKIARLSRPQTVRRLPLRSFAPAPIGARRVRRPCGAEHPLERITD